MLEEFYPDIIYIKGLKSVVNTLSRLLKQVDTVDGVEATLPFVIKEEGIFPVQLNRIQVIQLNLGKRLKENPRDYQRSKIENSQFIMYKDRIFIQKE